MYNIKMFVGEYNKGEFYSIMGKFFAERSYRRLLPYLVNFDGKEWNLFYDKNEIVGFSGIKKGSDYIEIMDFYVEEAYQKTDLVKYMCDSLFKKYGKNKIKVLTKVENEIDIWKSIGFRSMGLKGNYDILVWDKANE